ncbi:prepilin-type N-terminal cleavage/methylation domain-containing protein [Patescibacteria group bacterium]|nr:prepilin-type N-terminal cleavage/methylation domain-containing protein [Patescibacteria group bacterium]MCL5797499.1 prepilin-type N-terminal cleavage/methylation domain-containing protein [Patescibacteria group bacterium]
MRENGFTLIELLIVTTLVGIIGIITTQIFILGIKSQTRSETLKEIKQNGDFAMSVMESMVRNAVDIQQIQCNSNTSQLTITNPDGNTTMFDCSSGNQISSISAWPNPTPTGMVSLTSSKVDVSGCNFRIVCPTPPTSPKYVFINYTVNYSGTSLTPTPGSYNTLEYQSTISLRNYQ